MFVDRQLQARLFFGETGADLGVVDVNQLIAFFHSLPFVKGKCFQSAPNFCDEVGSVWRGERADQKYAIFQSLVHHRRHDGHDGKVATALGRRGRFTAAHAKQRTCEAKTSNGKGSNRGIHGVG